MVLTGDLRLLHLTLNFLLFKQTVQTLIRHCSLIRVCTICQCTSLFKLHPDITVTRKARLWINITEAFNERLKKFFIFDCIQQVMFLLTDGQVVFLWVLRFSPTFDERSARYKWNILERAVKPKSKKKKKKQKKNKLCLGESFQY